MPDKYIVTDSDIDRMEIMARSLSNHPKPVVQYLAAVVQILVKEIRTLKQNHKN
jgi:hypothetical protein